MRTITLRRAASRNIGGLDRKEPDSIVDAEVARLFSRKCNQTAEVMEEDPNRTCRLGTSQTVGTTTIHNIDGQFGISQVIGNLVLHSGPLFQGHAQDDAAP